MRALISLAVIPSIVLAAIGTPKSQAQSAKLSADESKQVEGFVRAFNIRLRRSRDLKPFLTEPLASDFLGRVLLDKDDTIPRLSEALISQDNLSDLRRLWIAMSNLAYLSELYVYTTMSVKGVRISELPHAKQYPLAVVRLLQRDPLLVKWWDETESNASDNVIQDAAQLEQLTRTLEKGVVLMRGYFRTHPPELTRQYRKNIVYLSKYYLKTIYVSWCETEAECATLPLHTKTVTINVPVLTLVLAWINGGLKILTVGIIDD